MTASTPAATRRNVLLLSACQALSISGNALMYATGGLVGAALAPDKMLSTLPLALQLLATTLTTMPASLLMKRYGRRDAFIGGALVGALGAAVSAWAVFEADFLLFCLGCVIVGAAGAFALYYRFAAAEAADEAGRNRAVSLVLAGGVAAAVIGPQLASHSKDWFAPITFAGSYVALVALPLVAALLLAMTRLPKADGAPGAEPPRSLARIALQPEFLVAVGAGTIGYAVMSFVMTAMPLAMIACSYPFDEAAFVIQWHILGMFVPSFFTGRLMDRFGPYSVMSAGALLMVACAAVNLTGTGLWQFWTALVLLGVGWNFLYIGSSILLTRLCAPGERAKAQGLNEMIVFGTVAVASASSGAVQHLFGWETVNVAVIPFLLAAFAAIVAVRMRRPAVA
jgi:MFS family permease